MRSLLRIDASIRVQLVRDVSMSSSSVKQIVDVFMVHPVHGVRSALEEAAVAIAVAVSSAQGIAIATASTKPHTSSHIFVAW